MVKNKLLGFYINKLEKRGYDVESLSKRGQKYYRTVIRETGRPSKVFRGLTRVESAKSALEWATECSDSQN